MVREFDFYVVPTPIGNIQDLTFRAVEILKSVDFIACEDTRTTQKLLNHYEIKTKCVSYHKYNERERVEFFLSELRAGKKIALVSDAGTPMICDPVTIYADSELLQNVEILTGDYQQTLSKAKDNTLFYFDPPYRPLSNTSSFNDYAKEAFNDLAQVRLKEFCDQVQAAGYKFMLSNSDCKDMFFDDLYLQYIIDRVWASRSVNANPNKRGKLQEILVHNYSKTKHKQK